MKPKKLKKGALCFKIPNNPSCVDLFLTNAMRGFQETQLFETGLSDFHKLLVTALKSTFPKSLPKIITYRSYKSFSNDLFRDDLNYFLSKENMTIDLLFSQVSQKYSLILWISMH